MCDSVCTFHGTAGPTQELQGLHVQITRAKDLACLREVPVSALELIEIKLLVTSALLLGARTLLVAPGLTTSSKKLLLAMPLLILQ